MLSLALIPIFQTPADGPSRLDFLVGDWTSIEKTTGPNGKPGEIRLKGKNSMVLSGTYLQIDEEFTVNGTGDYRNHILLSYDKRGKAYKAWWFTNSRPTPIEFTGQFEDHDFVLTTVPPNLKIKYTAIEAKSFSAQLLRKNGDNWDVATDAKYTRK